MGRNNLFVFDGIDGCGKTTLSRLVFEQIEAKYPAIHCVMPGGTALGSALRSVIKSKEYKPHIISERLMFAADFNQHLREVIDSAMEQDKVIICDRWSAFTDYQYGLAAGVPMEMFKSLHEMCRPIPKPRILFFVEVSSDTAARRRESRNLVAPVFGAKSPEKDCRIESRGSEFMNRVAAQYMKAVHYGGPGSDNVSRIFVMDGERKPKDLATQAVSAIEEAIKTGG